MAVQFDASATKYVNLFFHIYQPPVQSDDILSKIVQESYEPLTRMFTEFHDLKFTLNINYSLVELLQSGFPEVLGNIRKAYERGNLELTATGAYHPIFPLIPESEVRKQIEINTEGNRSFISSFAPEGVFPPEMAFEGGLVSLFRSLGFKWTIADDGNMRYYDQTGQMPYNQICSFEGLAVFLRSNHWTNKFANYQGQWRSGRDMVEELKHFLDEWMAQNEGYLIIALDGETFGHHHPELDEVFLRQLLEAFRAAVPSLQLAHLSEIYNRFPKVPTFIPPGSWSTDEENMRERDYFSWWRSNRNRIHQLQWKLTDFVLRLVRHAGDDDLNREMDRALYSCQYWWASFWKFAPDEIYKGAFNLMRILQQAAYLHGDGYADYKAIEEGEAIFRDLVLEIEKKKNEWRG